MISFKQYLVESKSAPLYHVTELKSFINIADDKVLKAKPQAYGFKGNEEDRFGKKTIFFTRNFQNAKSFSRMRVDPLILKFNQERLNQRYRIEPIHNWSRQYHKTTPPHKKAVGGSYMSGAVYGTEFEEIVEKDIKNPLQYIDEIFFHYGVPSSIEKLQKRYPDIKWTPFKWTSFK